MPEVPPYNLRLAEVRLERFKAAFRPTKPIEFHPFNAIIGRNGAGKSTVVEALQWIDAALRSDILRACDRYNGIQHIINQRAGDRNKRFSIHLAWTCDENPTALINYKLAIGNRGPVPTVHSEELTISPEEKPIKLIATREGIRMIRGSSRGELSPFPYRDILLLAALMGREMTGSSGHYLNSLRDFWANAVFLRLSPNAMADAVSSTTGSRDPILNESGSSLPNLLKKFDIHQRRELIRVINGMLPDFNEVEVSTPSVPQGSVFYSLSETMPSRGRTGTKNVLIPSWMLSEGTRRITALVAVLLSDPKPSFLCIEELENGLDPWSVVAIVNELRAASSNGIQVAFTAHSPWLLDHVKYNDIISVSRDKGDTVYSRFSDLKSVKHYKNQVPPGAVYATEG